MKIQRILTILAISGAVGFTGVLLTDCAFGTSKYFDGCVVVSREFRPAYVTTDTHTDSEGRVHVSTQHHPEEYHLFCERMDADAAFDIKTTRLLYHTITNGQIVTVTVRKGRFTGIEYMPRIDN